MKKVKRVIYLQDASQIQWDNIGVHFTEDLRYDHTGGSSNGLTPMGAIKVTLYCTKYAVNQAATEMSREEYPQEMETVLEFNQEIKAEFFIRDVATGELIETGKCKINTGTRADQWVLNM